MLRDARLIAPLRRCGPPYLMYVAKASGFVRDLRHILHQAVNLVQTEAFANHFEAGEDRLYIERIRVAAGDRGSVAAVRRSVMGDSWV